MQVGYYFELGEDMYGVTDQDKFIANTYTAEGGATYRTYSWTRRLGACTARLSGKRYRKYIL